MNYAPKPVYRHASVPNRHAVALSIAGRLLPLNAETGEFILPSDDPLAVRRWLMDLTNSMLVMDGERREFKVRHTFLNGVYMRELFIPKGSVLVGKIHKTECINIVSKGDISVMTETGSARVKAGYSIVSPAGIQKLGYAHEDTIFVNVFRTDETDVKKIEDAIAFDSFESAGYLPDDPERNLICQ